MSEERRRILKMLADGNITVDEAERLLKAVGEEPAKQESFGEVIGATGKKNPKFLRVVVAPKGDSKNGEGHGHGCRKHDKVNIRIPLMLIKAGVKLGSILPSEAKDKVNSALSEKGLNIDLNKLDSESIDQVLQALTEMSIDVDDESETVRIFCE